MFKLRQCTSVLNKSAFLLLIFSLVGTAGCSWVGRVSLSSAGAESDDFSSISCPSGDARFVAFQSEATNLVSGDTGGFTDIFLRDTVNNITTRISVDTAGNAGNGDSTGCSISADGRFILFNSSASNLVANDTNNVTDVFLHDRMFAKTSRVSLTDLDTQANDTSDSGDMSADARYIAFRSAANNIVLGDSLGQSDIFVRDLIAGTTVRVSVSSSGAEARDDSLHPAISADGQHVAFSSDATNLVVGDTNARRDIFIHSLNTGGTILASKSSGGTLGNADSTRADISADGSAVVFESNATNIVLGSGGWGGIFVHEPGSGLTTLVSVSSTGDTPNNPTAEPAISASGRFVAFHAGASNLVPGDTNNAVDVIMHDRMTGETTRESVRATGEQLNGFAVVAAWPAFSADEHYLSMAAGKMVPESTNNWAEINLRAIPQITVSSVVPNMLPIGSSTIVTISGSNFLSGATASAKSYVTSFSIIDENTITATLDIPSNASVGVLDVVVTRNGTGPGVSTGVSSICQGCVTLF